MPRDMRWKQLMHILGEINGAYHDASVKMGLADSEMQILYSVHMAEGKLYPFGDRAAVRHEPPDGRFRPAFPGEGGDLVSGNRRGPQPSRAPDAGGGGAVPRARGSGGRRRGSHLERMDGGGPGRVSAPEPSIPGGPARHRWKRCVARRTEEGHEDFVFRTTSPAEGFCAWHLPSIVMMIFTSIYGVVDGLFVSNFVGKTAFCGHQPDHALSDGPAARWAL